VVAPLPQAEVIKVQIAQLAASLQERLPGYESLLHTIHRNLATDPDTVHFLSDEEIGVIVAGLQKKTGTEIAKAEAKKMTKKGGKVDLGEL
jgi:hypothetical protein